MTSYEDADYYDAQEADRLVHETPEEAIEDFVDGLATTFSDAEADIRGHGPITVYAYDRDEVNENWYLRVVARAVESLADAFDEEYGDPNDDDHLSVKATDELTDQLEPIVAAWYRKHGTVWPCHQVGKRTYSADEVVETLRKARPDWFEEE